MIETLGLLTVFFGLGYVFLLGVLYSLWKRIPETRLSHYFGSKFPRVSIIIAARNEAQNIVKCLNSIIKNDFPSSDYEVLVIDDNSTDDTFEQVVSMHHSNINCLKNPLEGKKTALTYGVEKASFEIILCTDADCILPKNWIKSHSLFFNKYPQRQTCVGLVLPQIKETALARFQWLDYAATMVITLVGHRFFGVYLGNGAHISYRKTAFYEVNGYDTDSHVASGDDIFLIKKIATQYPNSIGFIKDKNITVETKPESSWSQLWLQRKRWATKTSQVKDFKISAFQGFVFLYVLICVVSIVLGIVLWNVSLLVYGFVGFTIKFLIDYFFLRYLSQYFSQPEALSSFMISSIVYIFHILQSAYFALWPSKYTWKGRAVR